MQQTDAVLKSTGDAAKVSAGHVDKLADSLSKLSGVDDETIQSGENMLLTFKNIRNEVGAGNDIFDQAATASLDLAAGMAAASGGTINMKSSTIQLGKALNDPVTGMSALTRVGVQFSEEQQKQIEQLVKHNNLLGAQKIILAEVTSQFQGSAQAQATTSGQVSVAFENLAEVVGGLLAPAIRALADGLTALIGFIQENAVPAWQAFSEGVLSVWDAVKPFAEAIGHVLIPLLMTAWHTFQDRLLPVLNRIKPVLIVIGAAVVLFATMIVAQFALVVTAVGFVIDKFLDLVGFVRDKLVEPIVNALGRVVEFVKGPFIAVWDNVVAPIGRSVGKIIGFVGNLIDQIQSAIDKVLSFENALAHAAIEAGVFDNITVGEGNGRSELPGNIPGGASGGFVARSGLAVIHKGETLTPAGGAGVTININADIVSDHDALVRKIEDALATRRRRTGDLAFQR